MTSWLLPLLQAVKLHNVHEPLSWPSAGVSVFVPQGAVGLAMPPGTLRGRALLLQEHMAHCGEESFPQLPECDMQDKLSAMILLISLVVCLGFVVTANVFFRENKEELIVPLCPSLMADEMRFLKLPMSTDADRFDVADLDGRHVCSVKIEWPDPFEVEAQEIAAKASLHTARGILLAQVVAQLDGFIGYELKLCRASNEVFGFVEAESETKYRVRSRMADVHLMTLEGDFEEYVVDGCNPSGALICSVRVKDGACVCTVHEYIDAGLVLSVLLAVHIHRRLASGESPIDPTRDPMNPVAHHDDTEGERAMPPLIFGGHSPGMGLGGADSPGISLGGAPAALLGSPRLDQLTQSSRPPSSLSLTALDQAPRRGETEEEPLAVTSPSAELLAADKSPKAVEVPHAAEAVQAAGRSAAEGSASAPDASVPTAAVGTVPEKPEEAAVTSVTEAVHAAHEGPPATGDAVPAAEAGSPRAEAVAPAVSH